MRKVEDIDRKVYHCVNFFAKNFFILPGCKISGYLPVTELAELKRGLV